MSPRPPIIVSVYRGRSQEDAARLFQAHAVRLAAEGYYPIGQSWAPGSYGCGCFLMALLLAFVLVGLLIFVYMLVVKPQGTLTVTYEYRAPTAPASPPA